MRLIIILLFTFVASASYAGMLSADKKLSIQTENAEGTVTNEHFVPIDEVIETENGVILTGKNDKGDWNSCSLGGDYFYRTYRTSENFIRLISHKNYQVRVKCIISKNRETKMVKLIVNHVFRGHHHNKQQQQQQQRQSQRYDQHRNHGEHRHHFLNIVTNVYWKGGVKKPGTNK